MRLAESVPGNPKHLKLEYFELECHINSACIDHIPHHGLKL
jgi:hypothetical protein